VEQVTVGDLDIDNLRLLSRSEARERTRAPEPFDSWFEVDVFLMIADRGYRVLPQYEVTGFKIDIVVEGLKGRLAVECDGDKWHGPERFNYDLGRQLELERCGWTFWRCRGSEFYRDPEATLTSLWIQLDQLAIYPEQQWEEERRKREEEATESPRGPAFGPEADVTAEVSEPPEISGAEEPAVGSIDEALEYARSRARRPEGSSARTIQDAIIAALEDCPNHTCTAKSITSRVLKQLGIITRGNPRAEFERRVKRSVGVLKRKGFVEEYKAKNKRLRLLPLGKQLSLFRRPSGKGEHSEKTKVESLKRNHSDTEAVFRSENAKDPGPSEIIKEPSQKNFLKEAKDKKHEVSPNSPKKFDKTESLKEFIQKVAKNSKSGIGIDPANLIDPLPNMLHYLVPESDRKCESCDESSQILIGRFGPYLKCSSRQCKKTKGIEFSILKEIFDILQIPCRECGSPMTVAKGYKGLPFPGCKQYPKCKTPEQWKDLRERIKQKNVRKQLGANK
jgi:very-short-patch-repair endonuclease